MLMNKCVMTKKNNNKIAFELGFIVSKILLEMAAFVSFMFKKMT